MAYIASSDRTQVVLLPELLDDYVTADNPVRFLDAFVAQLDLGALGARAVAGRPRLGGTRSPLSHPEFSPKIEGEIQCPGKTTIFLLTGCCCFHHAPPG